MNSTKQVDAFVLVVKLNPRAQTLKSDLEYIRDLFGASALKSLILLLIYRDDKIHRENFLEKLKKMDEVLKILKEGKNEEPNENWYCVWDNVDSIPGQEEELFRKINKLEPYTYEKFNEGKKREREWIDPLVKKELEKEIVRITSMYENNIELEEKNIKEKKEKHEKEKMELIKSRDRAQNDILQFITAIETLNEKNRKALEQMYERIEEERKESAKKILDLAESKNALYRQQIDRILSEEEEKMKKYEQKLEEERLERDEAAKETHFMGRFVLRALSKNEHLTSEEKKQVLKIVAKKGAEQVKNQAKEQVLKKGAQEIAKTGLKVAAAKFCNIF
jgi:DNA repair exonuclease SbcCD ATPase subunit